MFLHPKFVLLSAVAYIYFFSKQIRRSIVYGDQPRNRFVSELNRIWIGTFLMRYVECLLITSPISETLDVCMYERWFGRLDLYLPTNNDGLKPVVIFVTGGAWIIGWVAHWGYNILPCIRLKFVWFTISLVPVPVHINRRFPLTALLLIIGLIFLWRSWCPLYSYLTQVSSSCTRWSCVLTSSCLLLLCWYVGTKLGGRSWECS